MCLNKIFFLSFILFCFHRFAVLILSGLLNHRRNPYVLKLFTSSLHAFTLFVNSVSTQSTFNTQFRKFRKSKRAFRLAPKCQLEVSGDFLVITMVTGDAFPRDCAALGALISFNFGVPVATRGLATQNTNASIFFRCERPFKRRSHWRGINNASCLVSCFLAIDMGTRDAFVPVFVPLKVIFH